MESRKNPAMARGICLFSGGKQRVVLRFFNDCIKKIVAYTILIEALLDQTSLKLPVCLLLHTKSSHIFLLC